MNSLDNGMDQTSHRSNELSISAWGRRALLFTILFVFVVTVFPFQFLPQQTAYRRADAVLLWLVTTTPQASDFLNNFIFFFPLGFSLACWWQKRGWRHVARAWAAGLALSLLVEYLQVFLPSRSPQWSDVIANSAGSAAGYLIFELAGLATVRLAIRLEARFERFLTMGRIAIAFCAYAALMLVCSAVLQRSTDLVQWSAGDRLSVGAQATDHDAWQGEIMRVEMADRAVLPEYFGDHLVSERSADARRRKDSASLLLDLPSGTNDGISSLRTHLSARSLMSDLQRTNQFTVQVVCVPRKAAARSIGTLVSLGRGPRHADFVLGEYGGRWMATMRGRLAGRTSNWDLEFSSPPIPGEQQAITVSFDGSEWAAFVNGKEAAAPLGLNPGATLVHRLKGLHMYNVHGYGILYEALAFMPLGFLASFAARKTGPGKPVRRNLIIPALLVPPVAYSAVLFVASRTPFHIWRLILDECLIVVGFLLLNSHRRMWGAGLNPASKSV